MTMGSHTESCPPELTYNLTNATAASDFMYHNFQIVITMYVLPVMLVIGLLGNCAFLFVVARVKRMRTVTNGYLINLAVADSAFLSFVVITRLYATTVYGVPNKVNGQVGCIVGHMVNYTCHFAGLVLITCMSVERYIAVCHPLRHRLVSGPTRTAKMVAVCWLLSAAMATFVLPVDFVYTQSCLEWPRDDAQIYESFPIVIGECTSVDEPWILPAFHLTQTIPFFIAFFGNTFFYTCIVRKLHLRHDTSGSRRQIMRTRNHVALMLVANGTVFFLTLTSFEVTSMILFIDGLTDAQIISDEVVPILFEVNRLLLYTNSVINPFIYTLTNRRYRQAFRCAFTPAAWYRRRRRRGNNSTIFSAFPEYYTQYHVKMGGLAPVPRPPSPPKSPMVARPPTYSNSYLDDDVFEHSGNRSETDRPL